MTAKTLFFLVALIAGLSRAQAQLTVTVTNGSNTTPNLASSYSSLASAITDLNAVTAFSGPVTLTCSGSSETAPAGGFLITYTAATSAANNVIIDGGNTTLRAAAIATAGGAATGQADAVIKIVGSDYLTIQNFTITENSANTVEGALAAQKMTEFGIALFAASATDGAQNNTIQNNVITMSNGAVTYRNAIGIFSSTTAAYTAPATARPATSIAGTNSNNKIYGNTISGVAHGIYFVAPAQTATVFESGIDIGGTSLSTGNNITYGVSNTTSDLTWTSYSSAAVAGIYFRNGVLGFNVRYNTIANKAGLTLASGGMYNTFGTAPTGITTAHTSTFSNNTVTITQTAAVSLYGADFGSGLSSTAMECNDNVITINHTAIAANSAADYLIKAAYTSGNANFNNNVLTYNGFTHSRTASITNSGAIYGLYTSGGTTGTPTINVLNNTVNLNKTDSMATGWTSSFSGTTYAIYTGVASSTVNVGTAGNGNTVNVNDSIVTGGGTAAFSYTMYSVYGALAHANFNCKANTFTTGRSGKCRTSGTFYGVYFSATMTAGINIDGNTINVDRSGSVPGTGTSYGFYSCSSTGFLTNGYNITNNSLTFVGPATSGSCYGIYNCDGSGLPNKNFSNNSFTISGSPSLIYGIYTYVGDHIIANNTFNLTTSYATSPTIYGIYQGSTWNSGLVYNNTFTNLSATGGSASSPTIIALNLITTVTTTLTVRDNIITNMSAGSSTGNATVVGMSIGGGGITGNIYRNKIYNLINNSTGATAIINLIRVTAGQAGGTVNLYNNLLSHTAALTGFTNPVGIIGLNVTAATATHTVNAYYNTIYLAPSSTGANFGGYCVSHTANATSTTSALNLRNNIFVNNITPTGTGFAYAYKRSSTALGNFASTSNNNLFYCATGIFNDGTNTDLTIGDYKSRVSPREPSTVTENLTWLNNNNPTGANFLQLNPTIATQVESGALAITGFNDDYNTVGARASYPLSGQTNGGGTAPDMGAQEMDLTPADLTGPAIIYTPIANTTNTAAVTLTATITDASGVPTSGSGLPVLYWRVGNTGTFASVTATWVSGNTYTFSFGGGSINDMIQYFIVAQDNSINNNVSVTPSAGSSGTSINPPACSTAPTSPSSYTILSSWTGTYVIGGNAAGPAVGADYVSLGEALADVTPNQVKSIYLTNGGSGYATAPTISFTGGGGSGATATAYVSGGVITRILITNPGTGYTSAPTVVITSASGTGAAATANLSAGKALAGPVTLSLSSNYDGTLYEGIFPITIPSMGQTATNTLTIKPAAGVDATISGSSSTGVIDLYGADYTIIDGSNNGTASRNLTVRNTNTVANVTAIKVTSLGTGLGATNNTIKNMNLSCGSTSVVNFGVFVGGATIISSGADNDSLIVENNSITNVATAMYIYGTAAVSAGANDYLIVRNNNIAINSTTTPMGIQVGFGLNGIISGNTIDILTTASTQPSCISIETNFLNCVVEKNKITRSATTSTGGYAGRGITVGTGSATSNVTIRNNVVFGMSGSNWSSFGISSAIGIGVGIVGNSSTTSTVAGGVNIYNNSVNIYGTPIIATGTKHSAALWIGSGASNLDIRNNVFKNTMDDASNASTVSFAVFCEATSNTIFTNMDYNDYYVDSTKHGILASFGVTAYAAANAKTTLAAMQATFGQNANSMFANPQYNSNTVLLPNVGAPQLGAGTPLSGVTTDFLGTARSLTNPSMGAYENGGDGAAPTIVYTRLRNIQVGTSRTFTADIQDLGASATGVNVTTYAPVVYFKKSTDANTFGVANDSTGNGWKHVTTTSTSNLFTMIIDYSLLRAPVAQGDVIQYFVAAQDIAGNFDANPSTGISGTDVNTLVTAPSSPNSYIIIGPTITAGTYTIGTSVPSTYPTITAAEADIMLRGVSGPVVYELVDTAYTEMTETFPITFGAVDGANAVNTITFRPVSTATFVRVGDSTNTAASTTVLNGIFNFDNGSYYVWDGRAGGTGTTPVLHIVQNNTSGYTIQLKNDSRSNLFTYNNIRGCGTSTTYSNINMPSITASAATVTGNDSNTFSYNNIYGSKSNPYNPIYMYGTNDAITNDYNQFLYNNIFDFTQYGFYHYYYNLNSTIQGNSMYQTGTRTSLSYYMYVYYPTYGRQDIKDNYIGGSAPLCGGSPMTYSGSTSTLTGMYIYQGANNGASYITGNTFKNINYTTTSASTTSAFIYFYNGRAHIDNNTIGSQTDTSNIVYASSGTGATFQMIGTGPGTLDTVTINNNNFGGITFNQVSGAGGTSLRCVDIGAASTGYIQINNNLVGGTVANSLINRTANSILALSQRNAGVSGNYAVQMNNNTVRNATTFLASSNIQGILNGGTLPSQMNNNTVYNLTSAGAASIGINAGFAGSAVTASTISNNNIYALKMTGAAASVFTGLQLSGSTQTNVTATLNKVHSISASTNAGTVVNGILVTGNYTVANNVVRLGVDETGADVNVSTAYRGINESTGTSKIYYNTVYIGGSNTSTGTDSTFGIRSYVTSGTRDIRNNIFANYRMNNTGTGKHYAMSVASNSGLTLNNNNYYTPSAPLAYYNGADQADLLAWRTSVGKDANSMVEAPVFVAANGTSSTYDLHIVPSTMSLMESGGAIVSGVTTDMDGDARPGPVGAINGGGLSSDIGADEFDGQLFPINMGVQMLVSPAGSCAISGKTVTVRIKNYANQTLDFAVNPVTVSGGVSGPNTASFGPITLNTGTIATGATQDVVFSTNYDMSSIGTYTFDASTSVVGDANPSNDAMPSTNVVITALTAGTTTSSISQYCNSTGIPTLTTTAVGGDYQWYQSSVSANGPYTAVGTNANTYTPSSAIATTMFYMATISCNSSTIAAGDTAVVYVPVLISATGDTRCGPGAVSLNASAGVNQNVNWYTSSNSAIPVYTGTNYTPTVSATTNYYVAAAAPGSSFAQVTAGATWDQYTTGGMYQTTTHSGANMVFDATTNIVISSLDIYPAAAIGTSFTIEVRQSSSSGTLIASYTGVTTVQNTGATPTVAQTVPVNFSIPAGTNYSIGFVTNPNTWRVAGSTGQIPYPFTIPGLINIQGSGFGVAPPTGNIYQYYFYNWTLVSACESARQLVTATVNPLPSTPSAPTTVSKTTSSIDVTWPSVSGATSYQLDVATNSGFTSMVSGYNGLSVSGNTQSITGLASTTTYYIRVRAINASACASSNSATLTETTPSSSINIALTAYLQGMYTGSGTMTSAPFNADGVSPTTIADTITVQLYTGAGTLAYTSTATLSTSGLANVSFPGSTIGNSYYIVVRHRNSIAVATASTVTILANATAYDFSTAATQAYGDNLLDDGSGLFMIYTGDINQDGSVDFNDYPDLDISSSNGDLGYLPYDLNGDASVDFNDYPMIDVNSSNGIIAMLPF